MAPPRATSMASLHEPYERFPTNELRSECYRRKLKVIKTGPLTNATKAGFMRLLRDADTASKDSSNTSGGGASCPHTTATASSKGGTGGSQSIAPVAPHSRPSPRLDVASPPRRYIVSPPPSPPAVALASSRPPRPPRMDSSCELRVFDLSDDRGASEDRSASGNVAKKQKTSAREPHAIPDSQSTFSSQTSSGSTSALSSMLSEQDVPVRVKVKNEVLTGATISIVTRWERLFARLEAVNEKLQSLRGAQDAWAVVSRSDVASDVEFYTIMKRQLQKELLDCVSDT